MIEEIEIANFRGFSLPVTVRMRPLTVLIGRNSAGKSTLIKFLLMLRQTLEAAEGEFLMTEGRHVELGAFRHQQNNNPAYGVKRLRFRLQIRTPEGPSNTMAQLFEALKRRQADGNGRNGNGFTVNLAEAAPDRASHETLYDVRAEALYQRAEVGRHVVTATRAGHDKFEIKAKSLKGVRFLSFPTSSTRAEGELEALVHNGLLRPPREVLMEMRHLEPVRQESQRIVVLANSPEDEVGHHGEFAIAHLYDILDHGGNRSAFLKRQIQAITHIDQLKLESFQNLFQRFRARNLDTNAHCHLNDFGFGVSQCLPVLVQGCLLKKGQLFMVEQPEAQLHPTAQLELGSFFVDLWKAIGVRSLIETHSANMITRLRQLVSNGELLTDEVSIAFFTTENHQVVVRNLDIYPDGRLEKGLPREFFGADVLELAKFGIPE